MYHIILTLNWNYQIVNLTFNYVILNQSFYYFIWSLYLLKRVE